MCFIACIISSTERKLIFVLHIKRQANYHGQPTSMMVTALGSFTNMMQLLHSILIILAATTTTYILLSTIPPVHCGEYDQVINCTDGCLARPDIKWYIEWTTISKQFRCPVECICILGNRHVNMTCPERTAILQILYPVWDDFKSSWSSRGNVWSHTGIHGIEQSAFGTGFASLDWLDLSNNNIEEMHPQAFEGLTNLILLDLSNNYIVELHPQQFARLSLNQLFLSNNHINVIYSYVSLSHNLSLLDISSNNLVYFQLSTHVQYSYLVYLSLSKNKLSALPHGTFHNMVNLRYLDLSYNYFNEFESVMYFGDDPLAYLDIADIRYNMLQRVTFDSFRIFQNSTQITS